MRLYGGLDGVHLPPDLQLPSRIGFAPLNGGSACLGIHVARYPSGNNLWAHGSSPGEEGQFIDLGE